MTEQEIAECIRQAENLPDCRQNCPDAETCERIAPVVAEEIVNEEVNEILGQMFTNGEELAVAKNSQDLDEMFQIYEFLRQLTQKYSLPEIPKTKNTVVSIMAIARKFSKQGIEEPLGGYIATLIHEHSELLISNLEWDKEDEQTAQFMTQLLQLIDDYGQTCFYYGMAFGTYKEKEKGEEE